MSMETGFSVGFALGLTFGVIAAVLTRQWWWLGVGVSLGAIVGPAISHLTNLTN